MSIFSKITAKRGKKKFDKEVQTIFNHFSKLEKNYSQKMDLVKQFLESWNKGNLQKLQALMQKIHNLDDINSNSIKKYIKQIEKSISLLQEQEASEEITAEDLTQLRVTLEKLKENIKNQLKFFAEAKDVFTEKRQAPKLIHYIEEEGRILEVEGKELAKIRGRTSLALSKVLDPEHLLSVLEIMSRETETILQQKEAIIPILQSNDFSRARTEILPVVLEKQYHLYQKFTHRLQFLLKHRQAIEKKIGKTRTTKTAFSILKRVQKVFSQKGGINLLSLITSQQEALEKGNMALLRMNYTWEKEWYKYLNKGMGPLMKRAEREIKKLKRLSSGTFAGALRPILLTILLGVTASAVAPPACIDPLLNKLKNNTTEVMSYLDSRHEETAALEELIKVYREEGRIDKELLLGAYLKAEFDASVKGRAGTFDEFQEKHEELLSALVRLGINAKPKNLGQLRGNIFEILGIRGYNESYANLTDPFFSKRLQCRSGTRLLVTTALAMAAEKDIDNILIIYEDGHTKVGFFIGDELFAVETTQKGKGIEKYGKISDIKRKMVIAKASWMLFSDIVTDAKLKKALAKKGLIAMTKGPDVALGEDVKGNKPSSPKGALPSEFDFGRANVPPGDRKMASSKGVQEPSDPYAVASMTGIRIMEIEDQKEIGNRPGRPRYYKYYGFINYGDEITKVQFHREKYRHSISKIDIYKSGKYSHTEYKRNDDPSTRDAYGIFMVQGDKNPTQGYYHVDGKKVYFPINTQMIQK